MKFLIIAGLLCAMIPNTAMRSEMDDKSDGTKTLLQKRIPYTFHSELLAHVRHPVSLQMINALWRHFSLEDTGETLTKVIPPYDSNIAVRFSFPTIIDQMKIHLPDVSFDEVSGQLINHASSRAHHNPMNAREVAFVVCDYLLQLGHETVTTFAAQISARPDFLGKSTL